MIASKRTPTFQRNAALEELLHSLNASIADTTLPGADKPLLPPLFILGTPRSGTTLCMQWLAASGAFSYPSNLIARFWKAPHIGAMCQQMLTDPAYDFRGEFSDLSFHDPEQKSELGKTRGLMSPNEFWYFWRAIFPGDGDIGINLTAATEAQYGQFRRKLAEFSSVRNKPAVTKGMIVNHQVSALAANVPEALFLYLDRDPSAAAWSLLRARERMHGDAAIWYSFATPNRAALQSLPAPQQVMGQVNTIRRDIQHQLSDLPPNRSLSLEYAELCEAPEDCFGKLRALYAAHGVTLEGGNTLSPTPVSVPDIPTDIARLFRDTPSL